MTLFVLLIFSTIIISPTLQYKLESDKTTKGIILFPSGKCNIQESVKSISYTVDLTILQLLNEKLESLDQNCISEHNFLKKFHNNLEKINQLKNRFRLDYALNNALIIASFVYLDLLREELDTFNEMNNFEQCSMIYNLTTRLTRIHNEIDKLSNNDFSSFYTLLSEDKIKKDVANLLNNIDQEKYYLPFNFSYTFFKDFITHTNFSLRFKNEKMYITFHIPIYKSFDIFTFIPKPISKNNIWHSFKTDMRFITFNQSQIILFNETNWYNSCFIFNKMKFCSSNPIENACDKEFFVKNNATNANSDCFQKHQSKNVGLQINSTIYFLTNSNTEIYLKCQKNKFPIILNEPLILELEGCSIYTPFFHFENHFGNISYRFYSSNVNNTSKTHSYSLTGVIFIIIIIATTTFGPCIYALYKM